MRGQAQTVRRDVVSVESHEEDRRRRQAERDERFAEQQRCLDAQYAASVVAARPLYRWTVAANLSRNVDGQRQTVRVAIEIVAPNESDAWAAFCDRHKQWPNRRAVQAEIANVGPASRVQLADAEPNEE